MKYLGIQLEKPKVAFFGFTGCEGCQLQIANKEETLADLLGSIQVQTFRLISSDKDDDYDIAFVEGSITTEKDAQRLRLIRDQAKILVAMGACACLGGVHNLRERFNLEDALDEVYGDFPVDTGPVRTLSEVVPVDIELPGCPISKSEFEWLVRHLILGLEPQFPQYPVCVECKQRLNTCVIDMGLVCFGSGYPRLAATPSAPATISAAGAAAVPLRRPILNRSLRSSPSAVFPGPRSPSGLDFLMPSVWLDGDFMKIKVDTPIDINVEHIARVEGHGDIRIQIEDGELVRCDWQVVETPRFFEVMMKGLSIETAPLLAARICGICSISHALVSARALEQALGIEVPRPAQIARLLTKHSETLQSHSLHLFFLVAPDLLNVGSVLPVLETSPQVIKIATSLKGYANRASDLLAGRTSHPVAIKVGGMTQLPRRSQLRTLMDELEAALPNLWQALELFKNLPMPNFVRETEFVSLRGEGHYPFIGGDLISSDGVVKAESDYLAMTNEYLAGYSTSKLCRLSRDSFAVGALARFNNNHEWLHPRAKEAAQALGLSPGTSNPFHHNLAQLVECFHVMYESQDLIS